MESAMKNGWNAWPGLTTRVMWSYRAVFTVFGFCGVASMLLTLAMSSFVRAQVTTLSSTAAQLRPGEWREFATNNFNGGSIIHTQTSEDTILEYTDEAHWDSVRKKLYIIGTARDGRDGNGSYGMRNQKWVEYSEATNSWQELPVSFYNGYHSYDHAALDAKRGHYYVRQVERDGFYRHDFLTGQWSQIPSAGLRYPSLCCTGIEYFPEMDRLVYVDPVYNDFYFFNPATNSWTTQPWGAVGSGYNLRTFTEYDPVNGVLYFGGSNSTPSDFFKLDRTGRVTKLASPPVAIGIEGINPVHTVDPASGKFLVFHPDGNTYEYDPQQNSWRSTGTHPLRYPYGQIAVAAKIPEYGVIIAVMFNYSQSKVFLYRHSSTDRHPPDDTTPPQAPTNLRVM